MVSQGKDEDELMITVKDPLFFVSKTTLETIDTSHMVIRQTIPRQFPKDFDAESLATQTEAVGSYLQALVIVQLVMQIFLKGTMGDLLCLIFILQLLMEQLSFGLTLPANVEIFLEQGKSLIEFDALKPDSIL